MNNYSVNWKTQENLIFNLAALHLLGGQMCMTETWLGVCGCWGSWLHRMCLQNRGGHCLSRLWEPVRGGYFYMNTKLRNAAQSRWPQSSLQTAASCKSPPFSSLFLPPSLLPSALLHGGIRAAELDWTELTSLCSPLLLRCPEVESLMQLVFAVRNAEHQLKPAFTLVFQQYCWRKKTRRTYLNQIWLTLQLFFPPLLKHPKNEHWAFSTLMQGFSCI